MTTGGTTGKQFNILLDNGSQSIERLLFYTVSGPNTDTLLDLERLHFAELIFVNSPKIVIGNITLYIMSYSILLSFINCNFTPLSQFSS